MRLPLKPPPYENLFEKVATASEPTRLATILHSAPGPAPGDRYLHWDELRYRNPPDDLTVQEWWLQLKLARKQLYRDLPLGDQDGKCFVYAPFDLLFQALHQIDRDAAGSIAGPQPILDSTTKDTYYVKSLFEEAITSSQLEGAATTRRDAKRMLQERRPPRTRHEQMIYNNYQAMRFIREVKNQPLNENIILELQRVLTTDTLDDPSAEGRFRQPRDEVKVYDEENQLLFDPPPASMLKERMATLYDFANQENHPVFLHPVIRAILLHFWLAYEHPFTDGDGRTARALFYWSMARQQYGLMEYISISSILRRAPSRYARSFIYTETDDNDLTYFILYQLQVIQHAIATLQRDLQKRMDQIHETELLLRDRRLLFRSLNHRQLDLLNHGLRHPGTVYSIETHRNSNNITYQTARTDLLKLAELGLLDHFKRGRKFYFKLPTDLLRKIDRLGE
jgi:Fic family protein